jgi:hypothetical protein
LEKVFDKIASPTTSCIIEREREMRERAVINYFFQLHPDLCFYERRKTTLPMKLFWK